MPTKKLLQLAQFERLASIKPQTFDEEARTMEVVFSTGARVMRSSFFDGKYIEELSMDKKSVRLDRFKRGAPVLDSHIRGSLSSILGIVEDARVENGQGIARIRLSTRDDIQPIVNDIKAGIIRNISVGYITHKARENKELDGVRVFEATDWEPTELSFVSVPADAAAQARNIDETFDVEVEYLDRELPEVEPVIEPIVAPSEDTRTDVENNPKHESEGSEMPQEDLDKARNEGAVAERTRILSIKDAVKKAGIDVEFATRMIDAGTAIDEVRKLVIDELAKRDDETNTAPTNIEVGKDLTRESAAEGIATAILHRHDSSVALDDNSKRFAGKDMVRLVRESLKACGVRGVEDMSNHQAVQMALRSPGYHSSSDFPLILENVITKSIQKGYMEAPRTWEPLARQLTVSDFKQVSRVHLGEASQLEEVLEGGEYKHGKMGERAEKYSITKYGKMIAVTWEMLVNDDTSSFSTVPMKMGKKARDLESDKVWDVLKNNTQIMAEDGLALFDAGHSNLNENAASAVSEATLAAMRTAMRLHKDLDGSSPINIFPSWIYVPAAREVEAAKLLQTLTPRQSSDVNVFGQLSNFSMQMAVEPRLDGGTNQWYVTADTGQVDMLEVARLAGQEQPNVQSREGFDVDGVEFKIRHLFVAHAIDYRGFQRNDGV